MKKRLFLSLLCIIASLSLFISCENEIENAPPVSYAEPTAIGKVVIPEGVNVSFDEIYVRVKETGRDHKVNPDGSYVITNLEINKPYTLYFLSSPMAPAITRGMVNAPATTLTSEVEAKLENLVGGVQQNVYASVGSGFDNGIAVLDKTAALIGKVELEDTDDYSGTSVSIDGLTSYMTQTAKDGSFALVGIPVGYEYRVRYHHPGFEDVLSVPFYFVPENGKANIKQDSPMTLKLTRGSIEGPVNVRGLNNDKHVPEQEFIKIDVIDETDPSHIYSTTEVNDSFCISGIKSGIYRVEASLNGFFKVVVRNVSVTSGNITRLPEPIIMDGIGGDIEGKVSLVFGTDFSGTRIYAANKDGSVSYEASTDAEGNFIIENPKPGKYTISVVRDNYGSYVTYVDVPVTLKPAYMDIELMTNAVSISGKVDLQTPRLSNAGSNVYFEHENGSGKMATTDEDGIYQVEDMVPGKYKVMVRHDGFEDFVLDNYIVEPISDARLDVKLESLLGSFTGKLNYRGTIPPTHVVVRLKGENIELFDEVSRTGDFEFPFCPEGKYTVFIEADNYKTFIEELEITRKSEIHRSYDLDTSLGSLDFKLVFEGVDKVAPEVLDSIEVKLVAESIPDCAVKCKISNDGKGFFVAEVESGFYDIFLSSPEYETAVLRHIEVVAGKHNPLEAPAVIRCKGVPVSGYVRIPYGDILDGIKVELATSDGRFTYATSTDVNGYFEFTSCLPGDSVITLEKPDYGKREANVYVSRHNPNVLHLELNPTIASVTGTVNLSDTDLSGDFSGVKVTVKHESGEIRESYTDKYGKYEVAQCLPGKNTITYSKTGYDPVVVADFIIRSGIENSHDIALVSNKGNLTVKFLNSNPVNYKMTLTSKTGEVYTAMDNSFTGVPAGYYTFNFISEGYDKGTATVHVERGVNDIMSFSCELSVGSVYGNVALNCQSTDEYNSSYMSGINVTLSNSANMYQTTAIDGRYRFNNVEEGTYTLSIQKSGYKTISAVDVEVHRNQPTSVPAYTLLADGGSLSGTVSLEHVKDCYGVTVKAKNIDQNIEYIVTTGTGGKFSIDNMLTGKYEITCTYDDYENYTATVIVSYGKDSQVKARMDVQTSSIGGSISCNQGSKSNFNITATHENGWVGKAVSDSYGNYMIYDCPVGNYTVVVDKYGYKKASSSIYVSQGIKSDYSPYMYGNYRSLTITVNDLSSDTDKHDVKVKLVSSDGSELHASHDYSNYYDFDMVEYGGYELYVTAPGYSMAKKTIYVDGSSSSSISVNMQQASGRLRGTISFKDSYNHSCNIVLTSIADSKSYSKSIMVADTGDYELMESLPEGEYTIEVSCPGYTTYSENIYVIGNSTSDFMNDHPVTMDKRDTILVGKITLDGRSDHSGITVELRDTSYSETVIKQTVTDIYGNYRFTGLDAGDYRLVFSHEGFRDYSDYVTVSGGRINSEPDNVMRDETCTVRGTVRFATEGNDYSGTKLTLKHGSYEYIAYTESDGSFLFEGVLPLAYYYDDYNLIAERPGFINKSQYIKVTTDTTIPGTISLSRAGSTCSGKVVLEDAEDYSGVQITATDLESGNRITALTNAYGNFNLTLESDHKYMISYLKKGYVSYVIESYTWDAYNYDLPSVRLTVSKAIITGIVRLEDGSDLSGITVKLAETGISGKTDNYGRYTLIVPVGSYSGKVNIAKEGYGDGSFDIDLRLSAGDEVELEQYTLKRKSFSIAGTVDINGYKKPYANQVKVSVTGTDLVTYTEEDGKYSLSGLPMSGRTYEIVFSMPNADTKKTYVFQPSSGSMVEIENIVMVPNEASISGYVFMEGELIEKDIKVSLLTFDGQEIDSVTVAEDDTFNFRNVPVNAYYQVIVIKDGWDRVKIPVGNLSVDENRDLGGIVVDDNIAPVLIDVNNSVEVTEPRVKLAIEAEDRGTGLAGIRVVVGEDNIQMFDTFSESIEITIPDYNGSYRFTVQVYDKAGNWSSEIVRDVLYRKM